jgi:hypothetical protein
MNHQISTIKEHWDLDRIEAMILKGENLELCLKELSALRRRIDGLTSSFSLLYGTPNSARSIVPEPSAGWPEAAKLSAEEALQKDHFYFKDSVLIFLGYHVGISGIGTRDRRAVLEYAYAGELPRVRSVEYMNEWGEPETSVRLRKIAYTIYRAMENGVKRNGKSNMRSAVQDWKEDLKWLKAKFFDGRHCSSFKWPSL